AWSFFASAQARVEGDRLASAQGIQSSGKNGIAGSAIKPSAAGARREALSNRVPDTGRVAQAQEEAEVERQYYARDMTQMQAGNRRAFSSNRQGRIGGRR